MYSGVPYENRGDTPESWHTVCLIFSREGKDQSKNIVSVFAVGNVISLFAAFTLQIFFITGSTASTFMSMLFP